MYKQSSRRLLFLEHYKTVRLRNKNDSKSQTLNSLNCTCPQNWLIYNFKMKDKIKNCTLLCCYKTHCTKTQVIGNRAGAQDGQCGGEETPLRFIQFKVCVLAATGPRVPLSSISLPDSRNLDFLTWEGAFTMAVPLGRANNDLHALTPITPGSASYGGNPSRLVST